MSALPCKDIQNDMSNNIELDVMHQWIRVR